MEKLPATHKISSRLDVNEPIFDRAGDVTTASAWVRVESIPASVVTCCSACRPRKKTNSTRPGQKRSVSIMKVNMARGDYVVSVASPTLHETAEGAGGVHEAY